jgi:hypothetical protein
MSAFRFTPTFLDLQVSPNVPADMRNDVRMRTILIKGILS